MLFLAGTLLKAISNYQSPETTTLTFKTGDFMEKLSDSLVLLELVRVSFKSELTLGPWTTLFLKFNVIFICSPAAATRTGIVQVT